MQNPAYKELRKRLVENAKKKKCPILGHFELTARCNLDCKMCYVHTQDNAVALQKELSTAQWKKIFDEAYDNGMVYASLSGGECLIRKDFKELYLHLWNKKVYVTVLTNGVLINDDYVDFFKAYPPDMIQISLYGSSEDGYLNVTGHKGFQRAFDAIRKLKDAQIDVRVAITPSKYLYEDFIPILQLCKDNKFLAINADIALLSNRDNPEKNDYYLTMDEVINLYLKRAELYGQTCHACEAPEPFGNMQEAPAKGLSCNGGNCLATVTYDGRMYPCVNAMVGGASLLEYSYADAWKKTVEAASQIVSGKECTGCPYENTCFKCPAMRLHDYHSGRCNQDMCALSRALVEKGLKKIQTEAADCE